MRPRIYLSPPDVGPLEREYLLDAFDSNWIAPLGPHVDAFEREMAERLGVGHATALSSGTAALHLAILMAGAGPGDEVLCSTLTFAASANAIAYTGASPVFIDSHPNTWTLDPGLLEEELAACASRGRRPKAVLVVDIYGRCADYDALRGICDRHGVTLIEDAAEALGSTYRGVSAGAFGVMGALSFNGNKIITTSGGGMLLSNDRRWTDRARFLSTQARDPFPHYEHSTIGYNYRMSNLLAALGRAQLRSLDAKVARRRAINAFYARELGRVEGLSVPPEPPEGTSNCWLTCIRVDEGRFWAGLEAIRLHLEAQNIECRPLWKPMHLQPVFRECRRRGGVVSERLFNSCLCLPSGSSLRDDDLALIVRSLTALQRSA